ncbi:MULTISPECIES: AAA family ATPase [unclassified Modestobacter]|uniref:AAA family ATPase n=1 Tax=unclassified Modestobacter TaxID=2643866 RepID=UPI0022AA0700|nr:MULTISPECIES: AAA family ATPase [unclassified Modestobacter]MCZ2824192.1 AAA family ATPase [Modestobacter sp. VKM Ac-2981]MCZ2854280.1 AAA family ATPase [Modestobacter sp. VKM Ac-2982]
MTAFHRSDLHASAITDEVIDAVGIRSDPGGRGWVLPWRDGTEALDLAVFDRDKRPASGMKVVWPKGRTTFPNLLREVDSDRTVVVEGVRQSLAAASHAPAEFSVVGMNGCDGIHRGIADRLTWAKGQRVWLVLDADHRTNDRVRGAVGRVADLLRAAGATSVRLVDLPGTGTDGLDDVLAATDPARRGPLLSELIERAPEFTAAAPSRLDGAFFELADLVNLPTPEPLLPGVLDVGTVTFLSGKHSTYKTFVALDWSACVATGRPWGGYTAPVARPVLYVAAEGATTLLKRLAAWQEVYGPIPPRGAFSVLTRPAWLTSDEDTAWLRDKVRETGAALVVIDTWHRSTPGADENSNSEMGAAFGRLASLRDDTGATVLVLHHTGHAGERARGASAIEDDADAAFVVRIDGEDRSTENPRVLWQTKSKVGELAEPVTIVPRAAADSMVVVPDQFATPKRRRGRPSDAGRDAAVIALVDALDDAGVPVSTGYREVLRWASEDGRGLTRVTEPIVREAVKRRREQPTKGQDDAAAVGAVARYPSRGGGTAPQSPDQCGGNAVESPPQLSPAETSSAVAAVESQRAVSTAPDRGSAVERVSTAPQPAPSAIDALLTDLAVTAPADVCPDCERPRELVPPAHFWRACRHCTPATFGRVS